MAQSVLWTKDKIDDVAWSCTSFQEFYNKHPSAYQRARKSGQIKDLMNERGWKKGQFRQPKYLLDQGKRFCNYCFTALDRSEFYSECSKCKSCTKAHSKVNRESKYYYSSLSTSTYIRIMWAAANARAIKKGLPIEITREWIEDNLPERCPVLGIDLIFGGGRKKSHNTPSPHRVNSNFGYTLDNTVIISWRANRIISNATEEEIIAVGEWAKKRKG